MGDIYLSRNWVSYTATWQCECWSDPPLPTWFCFPESISQSACNFLARNAFLPFLCFPQQKLLLTIHSIHNRLKLSNYGFMFKFMASSISAHHHMMLCLLLLVQEGISKDGAIQFFDDLAHCLLHLWLFTLCYWYL